MSVKSVPQEQQWTSEGWIGVLSADGHKVRVMKNEYKHLNLERLEAEHIRDLLVAMLGPPADLKVAR
jgi:hypothetical protein